MVNITIGSILMEAIDCILVMAAIILSDFLISHNIELRQIIILSLVAYFLAPFFSSLANAYMPFYIPYLMPLVFWIIAGEILLKDYDLKNRAMVAAVGFVFYTVIIMLGISSMIVSMIGF